MGTIGIKSSKREVDARAAPEKDLNLFSKYPLFKVFKAGESTLEVSAGSIDASKVITHNLGAKSFVFVYIQNDVGSAGRHLVLGRDPFAFPAEDGFHPRFSLIIGKNDFTVYVEFPDNVPDDREYTFFYYVTHDRSELT